MMDKHMYNRWGKLAVSLTTNKPVEETEGQVDKICMTKLKSIRELSKSKCSLAQCMALVLDLLWLSQKYLIFKHKKMIDICGVLAYTPYKL